VSAPTGWSSLIATSAPSVHKPLDLVCQGRFTVSESDDGCTRDPAGYNLDGMRGLWYDLIRLGA
jgi:hypothetical protein